MAVTYQVLRPASDVSVGAWLRSEGSGDLWPMIDEARSATPDGLHIFVGSAPFGGDPDLPVTIGFEAGTDPVTHERHYLSFFAALKNSGPLVQKSFKWEMLVGGTLIDSGTVVVGATLQEYTIGINPTSAASITDYTSLRVRWTMLADGFSYEVLVEQAEIRIPVTFAHLDHAAAGLEVAGQGSGAYLEDSGAGARVVADVEGTTSLIQDGAGLRRRGSS